MTEQQDLSQFAAFDLDDLLAEIGEKNKNQKEVTAYLDRDFIMNMLSEYKQALLVNKPEFTDYSLIDLTGYNFTGADLRNITRKDLELCEFSDCDITAAQLDRVGIDYFREYMLEGIITYQGLNFEGAYLGPKFVKRSDLGIECYMCLNLSNLILSGSNFRYTDIEKLIFLNTNISGCDFTGAINLDPKQFAFSMGFENAIFFTNKDENQKIKEEIKKYGETLDPELYYADPFDKKHTGFTRHILNMTNVLDDYNV